MIVDSHVHIGKLAIFGSSITFEEAIKLADNMEIDKIFCTHIISLYYDFEEGDALILDAMKKYRERILGYVTVTSPRHGKKLLNHLERYICGYGFHGIKIYSHSKGIGGYQAWLSIKDSYMYPIFEKACKWKVPILAHATPEECDFVCTNFPDLKLIMAHMGCVPVANGDWHNAIMFAKKHKNLYLDTTTSSMDLGMVEEAVRIIGAERIIWGSDVPYLEPWFEIEKIRSAEINDSEKKLILGENILNLIKK